MLELFKEYIRYDREQGKLYWKKYRQGVQINNEVGCLDNYGYRRFKFQNKQYRVHQIIWLFEFNEFCKNQIDHSNGIKDDNRISNLREVSNRENQQNRRLQRQGHLVGTHWKKEKNKWSSQITINRKKKHLGYFNTELEAHNAYMNKLEELNNA